MYFIIAYWDKKNPQNWNNKHFSWLGLVTIMKNARNVLIHNVQYDITSKNKFKINAIYIRASAVKN